MTLTQKEDEELKGEYKVVVDVENPQKSICTKESKTNLVTNGDDSSTIHRNTDLRRGRRASQPL